MLYEGFVKLVIELAPELLGVLKELVIANRQLEARLAVLDRKMDQLIVREINSAYEIIAGIQEIASPAMRERHLIEIESNLLKNTSLDLSLQTAGLNNNYWIGRAYFGLSSVALLRGEVHDASRLLLRTFIVSPTDAREQLARGIYSRLFEPECREFVSRFDRESLRLSEYAARVSALRKKIRVNQLWKAGSGLLGFAALLFSQGPGRTGAVATSAREMAKLNSEIQDLEAQLAAIPTAQSLRSELQHELDECCKRIATRLLNDPGLDIFNAKDPDSSV